MLTSTTKRRGIVRGTSVTFYKRFFSRQRVFIVFELCSSAVACKCVAEEERLSELVECHSGKKSFLFSHISVGYICTKGV